MKILVCILAMLLVAWPVYLTSVSSDGSVTLTKDEDALLRTEIKAMHEENTKLKARNRQLLAHIQQTEKGLWCS